MSEPLINTELAERVLGQIIAHPETWQQNEWRCGSGMCFAGWAIELSGLEWGSDNRMDWHYDDVLLPNGEYGNVQEVARDLLGLTDSASNALFGGNNSLDDRQRGVKALANGRPITSTFKPGVGWFLDDEDAD